MNPPTFTLGAISYFLLCLTTECLLTLARSPQDDPQAQESTCTLLKTANSNLTIWALGFTASHFMIILSNQQAYKLPRTSISTSTENSLWVNLAERQTEPFPADATTFPLAANSRGFIGRTAGLGFAFSLLNSHSMKSSFIRILEGATQASTHDQAVTVAVNLPNTPIFFSYDVPGSFLTLQGEELLEGHVNNDLTYLSITSTVIGQISRSGVLQVGFVTDDTLYVLDNQARQVSFYGLNRWIAQEPFAHMPYGDVFDCDGSGPRQGSTSGFQANNALGRVITGLGVCLMLLLTCWASCGVARVLKSKSGSSKSGSKSKLGGRSRSKTSSNSSSQTKSKSKAMVSPRSPKKSKLGSTLGSKSSSGPGFHIVAKSSEAEESSSSSSSSSKEDLTPRRSASMHFNSKGKKKPRSKYLY